MAHVGVVRRGDVWASAGEALIPILELLKREPLVVSDAAYQDRLVPFYLLVLFLLQIWCASIRNKKIERGGNRAVRRQVWTQLLKVAQPLPNRLPRSRSPTLGAPPLWDS